MAITILLIHTYFGYFAGGGPSGVGRRGGQCGAHQPHLRRLGHLLVSLAVYGSNGNFNLSG